VRTGSGPKRTETIQDAYRRKQLAKLAAGGTVVQFGQRRPPATVTKLVVPEPEPVIAHFPPDIMDAIRMRPVTYLGRRCELAGAYGVPCYGRIECHHRVGKGMGGCIDPALHVTANGLALCEAHHSWVHRNPLRCGPPGLLLLRGTDFYTWPVSFDDGQTRSWLSDDGRYLPTNPTGDAA
jgi:hypothetical protein